MLNIAGERAARLCRKAWKRWDSGRMGLVPLLEAGDTRLTRLVGRRSSNPGKSWHRESGNDRAAAPEELAVQESKEGEG